jgi:nicotinamide-nucleotide amidase
VVDTNGAYLASRLGSLGIEICHKSTIGDIETEIEHALRQALSRSEFIITIGGLGPTEDDLTKKVMARALGKSLVLDEEILHKIESNFTSQGLSMPAANIKQAFIPQDTRVLKNFVGTASGLIMREGNTIIVALPGPPWELRRIFEDQVVPFLEKEYSPKNLVVTKVLKTCGLKESEVDEKIKDIMTGQTPLEVTERSLSVDKILTGQTNNPSIGLLAHPTGVDIRITVRGSDKSKIKQMIAGVESEIGHRLGQYIFGVDDQTLEQVVGFLLYMNKLTVSVAESCTGGLVSHRLTNIPGSSNYYKGSVVAYSDQIKKRSLEVDKKDLDEFGAVSEQVAKQMARGVRKACKADLGLAITGIAGPTGGTHERPVGLVYIALSAGRKIKVKEHKFSGPREIIKAKAATAALDMIRRYLLK